MVRKHFVERIFYTIKASCAAGRTVPGSSQIRRKRTDSFVFKLAFTFMSTYATLNVILIGYLIDYSRFDGFNFILQHVHV